MEKNLTEKETNLLRELYWKLQDAQGSLNAALNETAKAHGIDLEKEQWNASSDFRRLLRIK